MTRYASVVSYTSMTYKGVIDSLCVALQPIRPPADRESIGENEAAGFPTLTTN